MPKHIALFGGSFDPPHLGHIALVQAALDTLGFDALWLIPVGTPVHRTLSGKATAEQRLSWLRQIFTDEPRVKIMAWEINQAKPTPAIATLRHFRTVHPHLTPTWLMGTDSFLDMPNWVEYPQHQKLCNLAVYQRKGHEKTTITNGWKPIEAQEFKQLSPSKTGFVVGMDANLPDISSTQIRRNIKAASDLLPQSTCNAILACYDSSITNPKRDDT